ncbi:MAG: DNA-processing protein DprA [Armatimonadetes bacterium]|nr:DNA-processing protein DprA [Armatimonadota bacterium]
MWTERERLLLILSATPGLGERGLARLLESRVPLPHLFELPAEELRARFGLAESAARAISGGAPQRHSHVAAVERTLARHDVRLLVRGDPGYPQRLAATDDAPPLLYARGSAALLEAPALALLASRGESRACLERAAALAGEAARGGACLVAGHDRPVYRAAVSAAKAVGGGRILVLDRGLLEAFGGDLERDLFPTARVWGYRFDADAALALSPYPPEAHFVGLQNRRRDQLVCLLATRIVALEIRAGGVMEAACRAACARGTPVHVWDAPGVPEGNRRLLGEGFPTLG